MPVDTTRTLRSSSRLRAKVDTPYTSVKATPKATPKAKAKATPKADKKTTLEETTETDITVVSTDTIAFRLEHCLSCKTYARRMAESRASLTAAFPNASFSTNPEKPRSKSFEVSLVDPSDGSLTEVWSGRTVGPPRALKFPSAHVLVKRATTIVQKA